MTDFITRVLLIRDRIREFYVQYDVYFNPVVKFLVSFLSFWMLRSTMGYMTQLNNLSVILIAALLCSIFPTGAIVLFFSLFLLGHIYAASVEAFLVFLALLFMMFFVYYIFKPGDSYILVLVPLFFWLRIPYLIPLVIGLTGTVISAVPASFGVVIYYMIQTVNSNITTLTESDTGSMMTRFQLVLDQMMTNRSMMLMLLAFVVAVVLVSTIRRLSVSHSWTIAIGAGAVSELAILLAGPSVLNVSRASFPVVSLIIGILISVAIALIVELFLFSVDHTRTEYVQFEDDDYYYYVKAVPKMTVAPPQREVKRYAVNQRGRAQGFSETVDLGDEADGESDKDSMSQSTGRRRESSGRAPRSSAAASGSSAARRSSSESRQGTADRRRGTSPGHSQDTGSMSRGKSSDASQSTSGRSQNTGSARQDTGSGRSQDTNNNAQH